MEQLYIIGEANVWLRRSGLLKKKVSWMEFCTEITKRFSAQGSYDLTEKFNSLKQFNGSVPEYTKTFEGLMEDVLEENAVLGEL